ncbi:embryonic testis differentiation protein homolog B-like [Sciurus carolinensis]|uniref:embryonic testis differentiation protein homolog B-like n=1 Tax=Sciurus carolinensis TaxID=30640 RepID=UPI001FB2D793|nr:embryonic testis differentiation protein homolog B-like [Sciurus carolinensis]
MDKGHPMDISPPPESNMVEKSDSQFKPRGASNNILTYLINRQLGRPRNDVDLSKWVWMLT